MKTIGNTVLAQNVSLIIPLQESDHNFGIVHGQVSLCKVASQNPCSYNAIWLQFESDLWLWRHHSQLDCDSRVQTAFEIFDELCILWQSLSIFGCARRIFGSCKQNQVYFDYLRTFLVVLGEFLDNVNKTKKKRTAVEPPLPLCSVNERLQTQVRCNYRSQITFESLVWTGLKMKNVIYSRNVMFCDKRTIVHHNPTPV